MTRNVEDCALLLEAMSGYDKKDSTSINKKKKVIQKFKCKHKGSQNWNTKEYRVENMPKKLITFGKKIDILKKSGKIVDITLPHTKYALPTYYIVAPAEASSNLARYDGVKYGYRSKKGKNLIEKKILEVKALEMK